MIELVGGVLLFGLLAWFVWPLIPGLRMDAEAAKYCARCDNTKDCPACHGDDASCPTCDGDGKCPECAEPSAAVQRAVAHFHKKAAEYDVR